MTEAWDRLVAAVERAADLDGDAADAHLVAQLGADPKLLAEAREILAGGQADDPFLDSDTAPRRGDVTAPTAGTRIGNHTLLAELGRGGMGIVFHARQDTPQRDVALKILAHPFHADEARRRFDYEIETLARLHHPGIAQVYEAGIWRGTVGPTEHACPWFTMEYIEDAKHLTRFVEAEQLPLRQRLELFLEVCAAISYGHQKGVVHRDLKPDNVLVDEAGRPRVIDFGIAHDTNGDALSTLDESESSIVGTLPYMAPERVQGGQGAADVRSDVYALGVVLCELCCGHRPLDVARLGLAAAAQHIAEAQPTTPRTHRPDLPEDLDAIVLKAIEKRPEQRYATVEALAEDVRSHLDNRPIEARRPSRARQVLLFTRRHRALSAGALIALLAIVAGGISSLAFAFDAEQARSRAVTERERTEAILESVLTRNVATTLEFAPAMNELAGGTPHVERLMQSLGRDLEHLADIADDDPRIQALLANTWIRMGDCQGNAVHRNLGDPDAARASYERALAAAEGSGSNRAGRLASVDARIGLGELLIQETGRRRRQGVDAVDLKEARRAHLARALGDARTLHAEAPGDPVGAELLGLALGRLGAVELAEGNDEAAVRLAEEIIALADLERIADARVAHDLLAWHYRRGKQFDAALTSFAYLTDIARREAQGPAATHRRLERLASSLFVQGDTAGMAGDIAAAIRCLKEGTALKRRLLEADPEATPKARRALAIQFFQLGSVQAEHAGKQPQATEASRHRKEARAALEVAESLLTQGGDTDSPFLIMVRRQLEQLGDR